MQVLADAAYGAGSTRAKDGRAVTVTAHDDLLVADHHRRVRYRGVTRNQLWLSLRVAAVNLKRLLTLGLTHTDNSWAIA